VNIGGLRSDLNQSAVSAKSNLSLKTISSTTLKSTINSSIWKITGTII